MDTIAIGTCSEKDNKAILMLLDKFDVVISAADFTVDQEVNSGLGRFCEAMQIKHLNYLVKFKSDLTSNKLSIDILNDRASGKVPLVERLAIKIGSSNIDADVWIIFADSWEPSDKINYYSGSSEAFVTYTEINRGYYHLSYDVNSERYITDFDTAVVWKLTYTTWAPCSLKPVEQNRPSSGLSLESTAS